MVEFEGRAYSHTYSVAFSYDDAYLAVTTDKRIMLQNVDTRDIYRIFEEDGIEIEASSLSKTGSRTAIGEASGLIKIYDYSTGHFI